MRSGCPCIPLLPSAALVSRRAGFALEATLIVMVLISGLILAGAAAVLSQQRTMTADLRATQAMYVAEGGADAVMASISVLMADGRITEAELASISLPNIPGWTFDTLVATKDGEAELLPITDGNFAGLLAYVQPVTVRVGAVDPGGNRGDVLISTKAQSVPVFQFGVFYDQDVEVHPGAATTIEGWVHTNGSFYLSASNLNFLGVLTAADSVFWQRKNTNSRTNGVRIANAASALTLLDFDSRSHAAADFVDRSEERFDGRLRAKAHGTVPLKLPMPDGVPQSAIVAPRSPADDAQARGVKMAWKADFILTIDWATQGAIGPASPNHFCQNPSAVIQRDSAFNALPTAAQCRDMFRWNPLTVSNGGYVPTRFRDRREDAIVYALDLHMDAFTTWVNGAWAARRSKVLYVQFINVPFGVYPALRIRNGSKLPGPEPTPVPATEYGMTVATHAPLYVVGNYNWDNVAANWKPAALMGDAFTVLSSNWDDNGNRTYGCRYGTQLQYGGPAGQRCTNSSSAAGGTTHIYAAVAAGHSATTCDWARAGCGSPVDGGGFVNFPRMLEVWPGSAVLLIRGSLVSFFTSLQALQPWRQAYYSAPQRDWRFDGRFSNPVNYPPGTPLVGTVMQLAFRPLY